jgi:6-phosphogluconate dehydrogenase
MPGGNKTAWPLVKPIFQAIAAKADDGTPCCDWVGDGGAGHYVKMVHNGIEYGDMQLICEAYHMLKNLLGCSEAEMQKIFSEWDKGDLNSYLIEITARIFGTKDTDGTALLDKILDVAGQKGTGKWTGISALDLGIPLTLIGEAVFARCLSAMKDQRMTASKFYSFTHKPFAGDKKTFIETIRQALYASKIISYAQGFMLMRAAADEMKWKLNYGAVALMWRGGCIIRSRFLNNIKDAFDKNPALPSLLLDPFFKEKISACQEGWRKVVATSAEYGIPIPCFSAGLNFFDGYRCAHLPANLLQAQRDFFGAHTYERIDQPRGKFFHTNWSGAGFDVSSSTYNV